MLTTDELVHTAVLERYAGDSATGATYDAPESIDCYWEGGGQLVEKPEGTEVGAGGKLYLNATDLPVGSRIQVRGVTAYVVEILDLEDFGGLGHYEVTLSSVPRAAETRTAVVSLSRPTAGGWDVDDEITTPAADSTYASNLAARITAVVSRASTDDVVTAEETLTVASYIVEVDHDEEPFEGDMVTVTSCPGDSTLEDRTLLVSRVVRGSTRLERQLFCDLRDIAAPTP
jgi:hypothetical protein